MKNKLRLKLYKKDLKLPMNFENLKFDNYELKDDDKMLSIYKNNKKIKEIWYHKNGQIAYEWNFKNEKLEGIQYSWWDDGKQHDRNCRMKWNYKNGILIE